MTNERKTEDIVRTHFAKFKDQLELEEQCSDNPKWKMSVHSKNRYLCECVTILFQILTFNFLGD
jgi:hypothetical protein